MSSSLEGRTGVVVVGSVTADVTTFSHHLPARGETILGDRFTLFLGTAAGALAVTKHGASPSLPLRTDVDALLAERAS